MAISATFMAVLGLSATFLPQEALAYAGYPAKGLAVVFVQVTGALFLGFAFLNWMARGTLIGGIYSRPVAMGNFMHFAMVTIVLVESVIGPGNVVIHRRHRDLRCACRMVRSRVVHASTKAWREPPLEVHAIPSSARGRWLQKMKTFSRKSWR